MSINTPRPIYYNNSPITNIYTYVHDYIYAYVYVTYIISFDMFFIWSDLSTISVTIEIHLSLSQGLPLMSNSNSTLQFRAITAAPLGLSPLQVVVLGYEYFNETSSLSEDATHATYGVYTIMLVDADATNSTWQQDISIVSSPQYAGGIAMGYNTTANNVGVTLKNSNYYQADPIETSAAAGFVSEGLWTVVIASAFVTLSFMFYGIQY